MSTRYNSHLNKRIELEEGERFCPKCNGKGLVPQKGKVSTRWSRFLICSKCLGDGKIDWVEEVVGKKAKSYNFTMDAEL